MGLRSRQLGVDFERACEISFEAYRRAGIAHVAFMPIPMYPTGQLWKGQMCYCPLGKSPFDVYGYWLKDATMIGAEFKCTGELEPRLRLVPPGKEGSGVEYHQLEALYQLARAGGIARIVWNNCGQLGVLQNHAIINAYETLQHALATERPVAQGAVAVARTAPLGSKSVPWEQFVKIDYGNIGGVVCLDWLLTEAIL